MTCVADGQKGPKEESQEGRGGIRLAAYWLQSLAADKQEAKGRARAAALFFPALVHANGKETQLSASETPSLAAAGLPQALALAAFASKQSGAGEQLLAQEAKRLPSEFSIYESLFVYVEHFLWFWVAHEEETVGLPGRLLVDPQLVLWQQGALASALSLHFQR